MSRIVYSVSPKIVCIIQYIMYRVYRIKCIGYNIKLVKELQQFTARMGLYKVFDIIKLFRDDSGEENLLYFPSDI